MPDDDVVVTGTRSDRLAFPLIRLLPGVVFLLYFGVTVLLFYAGPWDYPVDNWRPLTLFLLCVHAAFISGYFIGVRRLAPAGRWRGDPVRAALWCVGCQVLLLFPTSALNTGSWIPNPVAAAGDMAAAYTRSLGLRDQAVPWVNYIRIAAAPALAAALPLCVFYWHRLRSPTRLLFVLSTIGTLALFTAMGANAGAAHWMVLFPWFVVAAHASGEHRLTRGGWLGAGAVQLASVVLFATFFAVSMNVRTGSFARNGSMPDIGAVVKEAAQAATATRTEAAAERLPVTPASDRGRLQIAAEGLAAYLSHGYYAVYLSLQEPFVPMYGVGNSVFLQRQVARILNDDSLLKRSYPVRIEAKGWNAYGYWATIYPWIASDVGFPGVVAVLFVIGLVTARVWNDVLVTRNPWAVAFFAQLLILLYYVPAHNKTMHSGEGFVAFWTLCAGWVVSTRRREAAA